MARVELIFDAWKAGAVHSSEDHIEVIAPRRAAPDEPVSNRLVRTLIHPDHDTSVWPTFFTLDGRYVVGGGYPSGGVEVWDACTGQPIRTLRTPEGYRNTDNYLVRAPDGKTVYVPISHTRAVPTERNGQLEYPWKVWGEIQVWDLETGAQKGSLAQSSTRGIQHAVLSPSGRTLAAIECVSTGDRDPSTDGRKYCLALWDVSGKRLNPLYADACMPVFSPDSRLLAAAVRGESMKSVLRLWEVSSGKVFGNFGEGSGRWLARPLFSPDGRLVAVPVRKTDQTSPEILIWDVATGKQAGRLSAPDRPSFAFSPDGLYLAVVGDAGHAELLDVRRCKVARTYQLKNRGFRKPVFSADGQRLAIASLEIPDDLNNEPKPNPADLPQPRIFLLDLKNLAAPEVMVCPHGYVGDLAFSPDGQTLALGGYGCVWLFDATTPTVRSDSRARK
jgi:WD40 repeat protein